MPHDIDILPSLLLVRLSCLTHGSHTTSENGCKCGMPGISMFLLKVLWEIVFIWDKVLMHSLARTRIHGC